MNGILLHSPGKIVTMPRKVMIIPENQVQKLSGIVMNSVVAFNSKVNNITEIDNDIITTIALFEIPRFVLSAVPMTTGKSGSMQGARIVNIPARIEIKKNNIILFGEPNLKVSDSHSIY